MAGLRLLRWLYENWMDFEADTDMTDRDPERNFEER
jgi:hypothetical protein